MKHFGTGKDINEAMLERVEFIGEVGRPVIAKRVRVVFKEGRDLNLFNVVEINLDGEATRYADERGRTYTVNREAVNYVETY